MQKKKAFTLIELLVVIAIISLLVSILLPSLQTAKDLARTVVCGTQTRNLGTAWLMYASDGDGKVMSCFNGWNDSQGNNNGIDDEWNYYWVNQILPYLGGDDAGQPGHMWTSGDEDSMNFRRCPASPDPIRGYDGWIAMNMLIEGADGNKCPDISSFVNAGNMVVFADGGAEHYYGHNAWNNYFTYPHNGAKDSNFGFADGHVETAKSRTNKDVVNQSGGGVPSSCDGVDDAIPPKAFSYLLYSHETGYPDWDY